MGEQERPHLFYAVTNLRRIMTTPCIQPVIEALTGGNNCLAGFPGHNSILLSKLATDLDVLLTSGLSRPEALMTLDNFIADRMRSYRVPISRVYTHQEINPTACPGRYLQSYMLATRSNSGRMASALM